MQKVKINIKVKRSFRSQKVEINVKVNIKIKNLRTRFARKK